MKLDLWVSDREAPARTLEAISLGAEWTRVGEAASSQDELIKHVQRMLGQRGGQERSKVAFYANLDADHAWTCQLVERHPQVTHGVGLASSTFRFWLAFDLFGDQSRVAFSTQPAGLAVLERRPPEPHPGLLKRPVVVPMQIKAARNDRALTIVSA